MIIEKYTVNQQSGPSGESDFQPNGSNLINSEAFFKLHM